VRDVLLNPFRNDGYLNNIEKDDNYESTELSSFKHDISSEPSKAPKSQESHSDLEESRDVSYIATTNNKRD
jgi:hypothetical protein